MGKPVNGRFRAPQSLQQLSKGRGWNSELVGFLLPFARRDFVYYDDDFLSDTMDATLWNLDTDAGSTAFAQGRLESGNLRGVTQNTTGDNIGIHFSYPMFDAARSPGCEIRWKVVTYTAAQLLCEFGLWDAPTVGNWRRMLVQWGPAGGIGAIRNEYNASTGGLGWNQVSVSTGPTTGYLMQAAFMVGTLANTAPNVDHDSFRVWSERGPIALWGR